MCYISTVVMILFPVVLMWLYSPSACYKTWTYTVHTHTHRNKCGGQQDAPETWLKNCYEELLYKDFRGFNCEKHWTKHFSKEKPAQETTTASVATSPREMQSVSDAKKLRVKEGFEARVKCVFISVNWQRAVLWRIILKPIGSIQDKKKIKIKHVSFEPSSAQSSSVLPATQPRLPRL